MDTETIPYYLLLLSDTGTPIMGMGCRMSEELTLYLIGLFATEASLVSSTSPNTSSIAFDLDKCMWRELNLANHSKRATCALLISITEHYNLSSYKLTKFKRGSQ